MKPHGPAPRAGGPARLRRTAQIAGIAIAAAVMLYAWRVSENNREFAAGETRGQPVSLRKFPYPYRAGLTISNDIDWTGSWAKFQLIQDFLSTRESTALGAGLGLDLAGSFLFWENPNLTIHYFMSPEVRDGTIDYIRRGRIDTLHSYGKKNDFSRSDAVRALDEMRRNGMHVDVWIDHTVSSDNLGDDVTAGYGDRPDRPEYHADLTIAYGIKYAWLGRLAMIAGQGTPIGIDAFLGVYDGNHPLHSVVNIAKEFSKHLLGLLGNEKYALHGTNDLVRVKRLDDGQKVYEFIRYDGYWEGVSAGATGKRLAYLISPANLDRLVARSGYMVVYTHLGQQEDCASVLCAETVTALKHLARECEGGVLFVTSTSKLLRYYIAHKYLRYTAACQGAQCDIRILGIEDPISGFYVPAPEQLEHITFYVPDKDRCRVFLNDREIGGIRKNDRDHERRESITITAS
jgi:hypothetical protein